MPISLRIPSDKEEIIKKQASLAGKTKTKFILEAIDDKLGISGDREQFIRRFAGWLTSDEADELRRSLDVFEKVNEEDWK
ncbi:MAG: DUF1778 domain-containing protein [Deltaproteobacteria bacterium]|nr:DUF1778 domain-containing protein [Deltaproteobacteria bacterium]